MPPNNQARIARLGAYALHATHDTLEVSAPGRKAAAAKLDEVLLAKIDADAPGLPQAERLRRLKYARKFHFARLAMMRGRK